MLINDSGLRNDFVSTYMSCVPNVQKEYQICTYVLCTLTPLLTNDKISKYQNIKNKTHVRTFHLRHQMISIANDQENKSCANSWHDNMLGPLIMLLWK